MDTAAVVQKRCDYDACTNAGEHEMVYLNPNIVHPLDTGWRFYRACPYHARAHVDPR